MRNLLRGRSGSTVGSGGCLQALAKCPRPGPINEIPALLTRTSP
jgi:hypothetical protein